MSLHRGRSCRGSFCLEFRKPCECGINLNPPFKFTLGSVANYGPSDATSAQCEKSRQLLHRTLPFSGGAIQSFMFDVISSDDRNHRRPDPARRLGNRGRSFHTMRITKRIWISRGNRGGEGSREVPWKAAGIKSRAMFEIQAAIHLRSSVEEGARRYNVHPRTVVRGIERLEVAQSSRAKPCD